MKTGNGRVHCHFRCRLRPPGRLSACTVDPPLHRSQNRHGADTLDAHQPQLLVSSPRWRPSCSTATSCWSMAGARAAACFSTSTAPRACGGGTAIDEAGGWQHDTLTEDTDLSYRAQIKGWKFRLSAGRGVSGRIAGRDDRLQDATGAVGKGSDPDRKKILPKVLTQRPAVLT